MLPALLQRIIDAHLRARQTKPMGSTFSMKYPRKTRRRWVLRKKIGFLIHRLGNLEVHGLENLPKSGPVIIAANHFNFVDPPLLIYTTPRMVEFIGGAQRPNSPFWAKQIPKWYGFIHAFRGGYGRSTFRQSLDVLKQNGVLGIFPEGGSWATLLRPARPGLAYLATKSGAPVVPISIIGAENLIGGEKRPVKIIYHKPLQAPVITATGTARRKALDEFSQEIMCYIASGLPDNQRGMFSSSEQARAEAEAVSAYPFDAPELRGT